MKRNLKIKTTNLKPKDALEEMMAANRPATTKSFHSVHSRLQGAKPKALQTLSAAPSPMPLTTKSKTFLPQERFGKTIETYGTFKSLNNYKEIKQKKFKETNPFIGTNFHNMNVALQIPHNATNQEVLKQSFHSINRIQNAIKNQKNKAFLRQTGLPKIVTHS
jgi:hypothetical protein